IWAAPAQPAAGSDPFERPAAGMPVEAAPVRAKGNGGMLVNLLLGVALVIAVGGVAFAVGRATAPASTATGRTGLGANGGGLFQGGPDASGAPGGTFNGGFGVGGGGVSIEGTVTAVSADSITLQLASGQTITIPTDAQTTYHQRTATTAAAVTSGSTIIVQLQGGRGAFGNGNGNGGQGGGAQASGAPGRTLGPASTVTVIPSGG
ncbi:MAG TPA: hypothetical protein VHM48_10155, partial [Candidatus Limnocylindrales bacterium]|nr:hypothetical protein [Candidatus Limnocylindrales bacterium]